MVRLKLNEKKQWTEALSNEKSEITLDGFLKKKLDNVKLLQKKEWDCLILIDGVRRGGKSTLAMTIGRYLWPNLSEKNFIAGLHDAPRKIEAAKRKSVLIMDEGSLSFNSKDALQREQKQLLKIIDVIGQKGLVLIVVLPRFFDLNRAIAISHSRFLLHIYTSRDLKRGRFCYFGEKRKRILYEIGKKNFGSYTKPRADFIGRFYDYKPDFYDEYIKIKNKSMAEVLGRKSTMISKEQRKVFIKECLKNLPKFKKKPSNSMLGTLFGLSSESIRLYLGENTENEQKQVNKI